MEVVSIKAGYIKVHNHHKVKSQEKLSCSRVLSYWSNFQQIISVKGTGKLPGLVTEGIS